MFHYLRRLKGGLIILVLIGAGCSGTSHALPPSTQTAGSQRAPKVYQNAPEATPGPLDQGCAAADTGCVNDGSPTTCTTCTPQTPTGGTLTGGSSVATTTPSSGAACDQSEFVLGTSNLPGNSDKGSTVVNIWTFQDDSGKPMEWFYQTFNGQIWSQANPSFIDTLAGLFEKVPGIGSIIDFFKTSISTPKPISNDTYQNMKNTFISSPTFRNNTIHHCFNSPLPLG